MSLEKEYSKIANAAGAAPGGSSKKEKAKEAKKEQPAAAEKPEKQSKKKEKVKEEEEEMDASEEAIAAQPKFTDPLAALPAGKFSMDGFKRVYSNEDTATKAIPYFWENFDPEHYRLNLDQIEFIKFIDFCSIWYSEYKYPEELRLAYMSCNLIGGKPKVMETFLITFSQECSSVWKS